MNKLNLEQIKSFSFIKKLKEFSDVEKIIMYGSRARGDHNEHSDLDLCVVGENINIKLWDHILDLVENNMDTLIPVDCVHYNKILNQDLLRNIDKDGVVV